MLVQTNILSKTTLSEIRKVHNSISDEEYVKVRDGKNMLNQINILPRDTLSQIRKCEFLIAKSNPPVPPKERNPTGTSEKGMLPQGNILSRHVMSQIRKCEFLIAKSNPPIPNDGSRGNPTTGKLLPQSNSLSSKVLTMGNTLLEVSNVLCFVKGFHKFGRPEGLPPAKTMYANVLIGRVNDSAKFRAEFNEIGYCLATD